MKIIAIVPAYNEQEAIVSVIKDLKSIQLDPSHDLSIMIINDGSKDNTSSVAKELQVDVIDLPVNLGIGGAVETGFKYAIRYEFDVAFQFDGDGQHKASEIKKIITPIINSEADVVIGTRFLSNSRGFKSTKMRRIGIKIFKWLNYMIIHQKITDSTSGFRAYNKNSMHFLADNYPTDYPEPESLVLLGKNGYRLKEVAVEMNERQEGTSSLSGFISLYYMIKVITAIIVSSFLPKKGQKT